MVKCCHVTCWAALDRAVEQGLIPRTPAKVCKIPVTLPKGDAGVDAGGNPAAADPGQGGRLLRTAAVGNVNVPAAG